MFRRLRHKLRLIRYYSAARRRTGWDTAGDVAFFASFFLCLPLAVLANFLVERTSTAVDVTGRFVKDSGRLVAPLSASDTARSSTFAGASLGNYHLTARRSARGWPLTTSVVLYPAKLDVDILSEAAARPNAILSSDDPHRIAIETTLVEEQQHQALEAFTANQPIVRQQWLAWVIAAGVWWIMLAIGSSLMLGVARVATLWVLGKLSWRRVQLRAEGKCVHCGYNLHGLEFNARCPECGELVW